MNRRSFLKILGAASFAIALPPGVEYLIKQIERSNYDEELLHHMFGDILNNITPEEFAWLNSLDEEYTLYRLNDKRVRITKEPNRKDVQDEWRNKNVEILEKVTNVFDASIRQAQYNRELGKELTGAYAQSYGQPYFWVRVRQYRAVTDEDALRRRKLNYDWEGVSRKTSLLSKGEILRMKDDYIKNPSLSANDLSVKYGISVLTVINYLTNQKKVNFGKPVELRKGQTKKCPHCKKIVTGAGLGNFNRWHGDNCKKAPNYVAPKRIGKSKYRELTYGEEKYLFEFAEQYNVSQVSIISNTKFPKPGKCGPLKGLNFIKVN